MADIQSAALYIGRLLVEEARALYKVQGKVKELRDEVEWMQCFLRDADASEFDNTMARRWVAQIREFAYEAEDIIEKFLVRVDHHSRRRTDLLSHAKKYFYLVWEFRAVQKIGSDIDHLKDKISALTSRLHTYGIKLKMGEISSSWYSKLRDKTYSSYKEEEVIGRVEHVNQLVNKLLSGKTKVFAICGEGGTGKTFFARKIYQDRSIRKEFEAFAWAYVSQPCQISSVEQQLLSKLASKTTEQVSQMTDDELKDELQKIMCKNKCLVVLDGIWGKDVWGRLAEAFPISDQDFKSRILITTRLEKVAKHVHKDADITELKSLNEKQARQLLDTKVGLPLDIYGGKETSGARKVTQRFSVKALTCFKKTKEREATKLKDEMLECCGGLPLAIVVLGGVLSTKKTLEEWKIVHKNIKSYLVDQDGDVPSWKRILEMSYYDLPYQLKTAFIYLGYFPTNLEIPKRKITQLWEVEGLVSHGEDDTIPDGTLQDVAEKCLAELVERSLVQVGSRGLSGKAKTCRLHDLMQEICLSKASKENWLKIVQFGSENEDSTSRSSSSSKSSSSKKSSKSSAMVKRGYRRLAIYCSESLEKLLHDYRHAKHIRSLLFFNTLKSMDVLISLEKQTLSKAFKNFKLLRVLDIENIEVHSLPDEVGLLIHLRYLSLKGSFVSKLPSTIRYLRCLQTLDLRVLAFVQLQIPDVLWGMDRLVHLYLPTKSFVVRHHASKIQLKGLRSLETLVNFSNLCQEQDVCKLTNLRKFSSSDFLCTKEVIDLFAPSTSTLHHLDRISLRLDGQILNSHSNILEGLHQLRKLWLKGQLPELQTVTLPNKNLVELSLCWSNLGDDPMPVLENLSQLKKLSLEQESYTGKTMSCSSGGFRELSYLAIKGVAHLEEWEVNPGAMPKLVFMEINECRNLKRLPEGFKYVSSLQELTLSYMPLSFYQHWVPDKNLEKWPDYCHVKHVPYIHVLNVLDDRQNSEEEATWHLEIET